MHNIIQVVTTQIGSITSRLVVALFHWVVNFLVVDRDGDIFWIMADRKTEQNHLSDW